MLAAVAEGDVDPVLLAGGGGIGAILRVAQGSSVLGVAASWSASWPAPWPVSLASLRMKPSSSWIFCITLSTVFDVPPSSVMILPVARWLLRRRSDRCRRQSRRRLRLNTSPCKF